MYIKDVFLSRVPLQANTIALSPYAPHDFTHEVVTMVYQIHLGIVKEMGDKTIRDDDISC